MECGICKKSHSGAFWETKKYGFVSIECFIELANRTIEKIDSFNENTNAETKGKTERI